MWVRPLPDAAVVGVATLGFGRKVPAPGTWGSVAGVLLYTVFFAHAAPLAFALGCAVCAYVAAAFCDEAEKRLHQTDPGAVNIDECVAMPFVYIGTAAATALPYWAIILIGFGFFRLFDIWKPFGIARLQQLPGGIGVMVDDLAAALAACAALHITLWAVAYAAA